MEINEYRVFADKCFRDTPPPCGAVCPLAYDMREFIKLMQRGSYRSAYRLYRNSVIFPAFVSELCPGNCESACVRAQFPGDSAIGIKGLEKVLVAKMAGKKPERYQIPKKNQKIAVVGGGTAGLACAYRLSSFGYTVDLYERDSLLGGYAKNLADPQWCHDTLLGEFASVNAAFHMSTEVTDLSVLDADAYFLATGGDESLFPAAGAADSGVFFAALDPTETIPEAIARGLRAVTAIEEFLKIGKGSYEAAPVRAKADERYYGLDYDRKGKEVVPGKGEPEAYRCMSCSCDACMKACPLMEKDKIFPKRMCNEVILTLKPNMSKRTSVRMVMGCTDCGQCREACPEHIDMGKCLEQARIDFYESGAMAPAFHDFWLQDMDFSLSDEAAFVVRQDEKKDCDILFFPGCQLGASDPVYVQKAYEAVCRIAGDSGNAGLYAGCCGVPALWAGQTAKAKEVASELHRVWESLGRPKLVTACPTCLKNLRRSVPEMEVQSLYVYLAEHGNSCVENSPVTGKTVRVLDPCASSEDTESQMAVRKLLADAGYTLENADPDVGCCGFGGHIVTSVPELQKRFAERRVSEKDGILVSYCANCRDVFANEGADARHLIGLLFGIEEEHRLPPDLDERRGNRRRLKAMYMQKMLPQGDSPSDSREDSQEDSQENSQEKFGETTVGVTGDASKAVLPEVLIQRSILDKMNREMILREQVLATLLEAEEKGSMILDEADGLYYAHKRFTTTTVWVVYCKNGASIQVTNVYVHRVDIREDD